MVFNFQALGLLIIFVIICVYYFRDKRLSQEGNLYKIILLASYVMQLLYISTFIAIKNSNFINVFSKLYLVSCGFIFSLFMAYFLYVGLKDKYKSKQSIYLEKIKNVKVSLLVFNIITILGVLLFRVRVDNNILLGSAVNFVYIIQSFYILIGLISLISFRKYIRNNKFYSLLVVFIINFVALVLSLRFSKIPFMNSSVIINVLFMYLVVENSWVKEIDKLKLERDHAVKNNIEKSAFLTNMSHEIRTPLNTIDGFSQVIMDSDDINSIKEDARDIRIASKNLVDIINGIIDISIIESGKLEILKENYNVYDMFDNVISITNSRLKENDVKFVTDIDKDIPKVLYGDSTRIEQVLLNLLTNAIKYTKKGSITLKVDTVKSSSVCRLKISVIDTGVGIKEEDLNRIFGGLEERDGRERDGYSLGLVVSKQLLDLMDGKIDVESTYGKGSTFVVTIDQKIAKEETSTKTIKKVDVKPFDCKKKKILVVDDNKLNIKVISRMLEPYNIAVVEAFSGQECLDILDKDNEFSLIFMDDLMPKMSGTETLDILKKIERVEGFEIPVVVITANAISGMKEKYLKVGFDDYLAKPIDKAELHRILKYFLKDKKD